MEYKMEQQLNTHGTEMKIQNITEIEMRNGTYMRIQIGTKFGIQTRTGNRRAKWSIN